MKEFVDKTIRLKNNIVIKNTKIYIVTNENDTYILVLSKEFNTLKNYIPIDEIESIFKKGNQNNTIDLRSYSDRTYIIKNNQEILFTI